MALIREHIEDELYRYMGTICYSYKCIPLRIGGSIDHVHILCKLARTITISELVKKIKAGSTKWIKTKGQEFNSFSWQNGYGVFSVGNSQIPTVIKYIANQKYHHKKLFRNEYTKLLENNDIKFDEKHILD